MNSITARIHSSFTQSMEIKMATLEHSINLIAEASEEIVHVLLEGHKILTCGNGSAACEAMRFSCEMLNRFKEERPALPAIALSADMATITAIANDHHFSDIFAKQIRALGYEGDLLLAFDSSDHATNIIHAIKAAHDKNMTIVVLSGEGSGTYSEYLWEKDIEIRVNAHDNARVQETHQLILHAICDVIDFRLFGHGETLS